MDPDQDQPRRVPAPRDGGRDTGCDSGEAWFPVVPAPRRAPSLECLPSRVTTPGERPVPSAALVVAPRSSALAVSEPAVPGLLRCWVRTVAHAVHVAVDGLRSLLGTMVPAPASR